MIYLEIKLFDTDLFKYMDWNFMTNFIFFCFNRDNIIDYIGIQKKY